MIRKAAFGRQREKLPADREPSFDLRLPPPLNALRAVEVRLGGPLSDREASGARADSRATWPA